MTHISGLVAGRRIWKHTASPLYASLGSCSLSILHLYYIQIYIYIFISVLYLHLYHVYSYLIPSSISVLYLYPFYISIISYLYVYIYICIASISIPILYPYLYKSINIKHICVFVQPKQFCSKQLFSYKLKPMFVQLNTFHDGEFRCSESLGTQRLLGNMDLAALHSQKPPLLDHPCCAVLWAGNSIRSYSGSRFLCRTRSLLISMWHGMCCGSSQSVPCPKGAVL